MRTDRPRHWGASPQRSRSLMKEKLKHHGLGLDTPINSAHLHILPLHHIAVSPSSIAQERKMVSGNCTVYKAIKHPHTYLQRAFNQSYL